MSQHRIVLRITRSQQMALLDVILDYLRKPDHIETFVDVVNGTETTLGELLSRIADTSEIEVI